MRDRFSPFRPCLKDKAKYSTYQAGNINFSLQFGIESHCDQLRKLFTNHSEGEG
jgi:hypothetical protein